MNVAEENQINLFHLISNYIVIATKTIQFYICNPESLTLFFNSNGSTDFTKNLSTLKSPSKELYMGRWLQAI